MSVSAGRLTAHDLLTRPDDGRRYELLDGVLREMSPSNPEHADVLGNVATIVGTFLRTHRLVRLMVGDPGVLLRRDPARVRAPDA